MAFNGVTLYADADPDLNPVDGYRCVITRLLSEVSGVSSDLIYPALQWQTTLTAGDLVLAVPRLRIKGSPPKELAKSWVEKFPKHPLLAPPEADDIYIRFRFAPEQAASAILPIILEHKENYGFNPQHGLRCPSDPSKGAKKVLIEFSSPNIAKNFHAGHLRSTIIGGFLSKLFSGCGWQVHRMNYLGDWGRQYGLLAIAWQKFGDQQKFEENPISHLFDIYVKICALFEVEEDAYKQAKAAGQDTSVLESQGLYGEVKAYFKRMEDGDKEAIDLWKKFRSISIEKYKQSYARLNIVFDEYAGESVVRSESMALAEKILKERGITDFDEGATIIDFKKYGAKALDVAVIRNRNGTSNYLLRDIGAAIQRWEEHHFDKSVYVIMDEQASYVKRLFKIMELLGPPYDQAAQRMEYVPFGKVAGMSTRKGTVKFLDDILDECRTVMHDTMRKNEDKYKQVEKPELTADQLGISACVVQDMSSKKQTGYKFAIERMTSFEGDTGPYLQYAHARLCSIARNSGYSDEDLHKADLSLLKEQHAVDLIRLMGQYPDQIKQTLGNLEASTIITYLFKLTHQLSSGYDSLRVINAPEGPEVSKARAALYLGARQVIANGLCLIGLDPIERM